jgi:hypothetical protein
MVGRDAELGRVAAFLDRVDDSRGLLFEGPAGIGKTTLWAAAVQAARDRSFCVLVSRPSGSEARLSFSALADLLQPVVDEALADLPAPQRRALEVALLIREAGPSPPDPRAVAAALSQALRSLAGSRPVVVALDDIQWLDEPSARAIEFALRRLGELPVVVVAARRTGVGTSVPLDLERSFPDLDRVSVGPLSLGALFRLVASRLDAAFPRPILVRLHEVSGGNPFYAMEIARALQRSGQTVTSGGRLPVPDNLHDLVRERLHALSSSARHTLLTAALLAQPMLAVMERASVSPDRIGPDVEEAVAADVVAIDGDDVRFTHPLLAEGVIAAASPGRVREVHLRLAEVVANAEERARHLAAGTKGPSREVAVALDEAAELASARGAPTAAAALLDLAAVATPADAIGERARRQIEAAEHRIASGETAAVREVLGLRREQRARRSAR